MAEFQPTPIVVPTDLSSAAVAAVQTARHVAKSDEDVIVVYVGLDHELVAPADVWGMGEIAQENTEDRRRFLKNWVAKNQLGDVRQEVRSGDPGLEICKLATEQSSPLIVIPSHGRKGLSRLLLGSVAERVIRHADCSVLVVRRHEDSELEEGAWLPRKRVIVPVDLSESTELAIETALQLVADPQHLGIVNAVYTISDTLVAGSIAVSQDDVAQNRRECLLRYLESHGWSDLNTHILFGEPGMAIAEYADEKNADLIVMPSHGFHGLNRLLLGSTTERVLRHSKAPILVLRRFDAEPRADES